VIAAIGIGPRAGHQGRVWDSVGSGIGPCLGVVPGSSVGTGPDIAVVAGMACQAGIGAESPATWAVG